MTDLVSIRDQHQNTFKKLDEYKEYFNDKLEHIKSQREQDMKIFESQCKTLVTSKSTPVVNFGSFLTFWGPIGLFLGLS